MGHRYQKGSKPPDGHQRDRGKPGREYVLQGGIPWPELGCGTPYVLGPGGVSKVSHVDRPKEEGVISWVEWCHPDGAHMPDGARMTKAKTPRLREGAWWAVVSWDRRDHHDALTARHPLAHLVAVTPS